MKRSNVIFVAFTICLGLIGFAFVALSTPEPYLWIDRWRANRLDNRIAEARKGSDDEAVALLREMLREKTFERERAMVRLYRLKFAPEVVAAASPELVSILEEDGAQSLGSLLRNCCESGH